MGEEFKLLPLCHPNAREMTMIWVCSGAANVGKIAHEVGVRLTKEGYGRLCCVTAIAAGSKLHEGIAKNAKRNLVINGCANRCASKVLENVGARVDYKIDISQFLRKMPTLDFYEGDIEKITEFIINDAHLERNSVE